MDEQRKRELEHEPRQLCSVIGCDETGTEARTPPDFKAPEHFCPEHAAEYDAAEDKDQYVATRLCY